MQERIELAHGISAAMRRFRGRGIDVEAMLTREDYAHDILQQCRISGDLELKLLAAKFLELGVAACKDRRPQARTLTPS